METLIDALKNDWQGHEALRADIRKNGRFFGNNDERTDELVNRLIADLDALANKRALTNSGYTFSIQLCRNLQFFRFPAIFCYLHRFIFTQGK